MIVSRKVSSSSAAGLLAVLLVWAADRYLGIALTTEQAMLGVTALSALAGYFTREDSRVVSDLKLKGRHRQVTVGELREQREQDRADGLYGTAALPEVKR